jgi:hypothetical protein
VGVAPELLGESEIRTEGQLAFSGGAQRRRPGSGALPSGLVSDTRRLGLVAALVITELRGARSPIASVLARFGAHDACCLLPFWSAPAYPVLSRAIPSGLQLLTGVGVGGPLQCRPLGLVPLRTRIVTLPGC